MARQPLLEVSRAEALRLWWRIGWLGFGGPAGQIALMHRELVEKRRWISEPRFLHALSYCMLLPGPEAQQLAIYVGWLLHRTWGGIVAGVLFVLPGALVVAVLSAIYVAYGGAAPVAALFFGLKAAVLAIVVEALLRIGRRALRTRFLVAVAGLAFVAIFALQVPFPLIILAAALCGGLASRLVPRWLPAMASTGATGDAAYVVDAMLAAGRAEHTAPSLRRAAAVSAVSLALWMAPVLVAAWWLGSEHVVVGQGMFFSQAAVVTFGGAYAVLAYVAQRAVEDFAWLSPGEMVDGVALAETTPGPLLLVLQFVGFVAAYRFPGSLDPWAAAVLGAAMTTWVTFVPSFFFIFLGAPWVEALRHSHTLQAALAAITAAVVGVILNLSAWFAMHTLFAQVRSRPLGPLQIELPVWTSLEPGSLALSVLALVAMLRFKLQVGWTMAAAALLGGGYWWLRHGV